MESLAQLKSALIESGLIVKPESHEEGFIYGIARLANLGIDTVVNIDPELEDYPKPDVKTLVAGLRSIVTIEATAWQAIIDDIVEEIEDAVGDEDEIEELASLADDLELASIVVFPDAIVLSFAADTQFPESWIRVQLDVDDLGIDDVSIDEQDDDDDESALEFDSLEDLLDHVSSAPESTDEK